MIGLALITFVAVLGEGFKKSFVSAVDKQFVADYSVSAGNNGEPLDRQGGPGCGAGARSSRSSPRSAPATPRSNGKSVRVNGVDAATSPKVVEIDWKTGSDSVPGQLGSGRCVRRRSATPTTIT